MCNLSVEVEIKESRVTIADSRFRCGGGSYHMVGVWREGGGGKGIGRSGYGVVKQCVGGVMEVVAICWWCKV